MVVDRVDASALCGMEPFLPLGSVVRIGLPTPFCLFAKWNRIGGIECEKRGRRVGFLMLAQKNRSS